MGARTLKTGLAVAITASICNLLDLPVIFAALSTVINLKPSVVQSWKNALEQLSVNLLGVVIAFVVGLTVGSNPLTIGLTTMLIIWICGRLDWSGGTVMGILAALFILTATPDQFVDHAIDRTSAIFVGLIIAILVNYFILPPRYGQRLRAILAELGTETSAYLTLVIEHYTKTKLPDPETAANLKQNIMELSITAQDLMSRYHEQVGRAKPRGITPSRNPALLQDYLDFQRDLFERTLYLDELIPERILRRQKAGNQPVSSEFQHVLGHIRMGAQRVVHLNQDLQKAILEDKQVDLVPVIQDYWDDLDDIINHWKGKFSGTYYIHALLEIGLILSDIKWAASHARNLFRKI